MLIRGAQKTKEGTYETKCGWCDVLFKKRLSQKGKTGDFCSVTCGESYKRGHEHKFITKQCPTCENDFECLFRKQTTFCSVSCSKKGKNHPLYGKTFKWPENKKAWTYGLNKKTDQRISDMANKISKTQKCHFASGLRSNVGENNPNHNKTRKRKIRTEAQLERYSKAAIKRIEKGTACSHKFLKKGWYTSTKTHAKMFYRSGYELIYMKYLDQEKSVSWYEYEPFSIKYESGRRYLPDFLVTMRDGEKFLIEIKGKHLIKEESTKKKTEAGRVYCQKNNMTYKIISNEDIKKIEQNHAD